MSSQEHAERIMSAFEHAAETYLSVHDRVEARGEFIFALTALVSVADKAEAVAEAARELLGDDDMPNHWDDCVCSYCKRHRALRSALDAFRSETT